MHLPDGEWPDLNCRARPIVKLNKTLYGIKQANSDQRSATSTTTTSLVNNNESNWKTESGNRFLTSN
jgi:hypothetical protein